MSMQGVVGVRLELELLARSTAVWRGFLGVRSRGRSLLADVEGGDGIECLAVGGRGAPALGKGGVEDGERCGGDAEEEIDDAPV